jgi:hypothetical protein
MTCRSSPESGQRAGYDGHKRRKGSKVHRLARDYERLAEMLAGLHFVAFAILMAHRFITFMVQNA